MRQAFDKMARTSKKRTEEINSKEGYRTISRLGGKQLTQENTTTRETYGKKGTLVSGKGYV